MTGSTSRTLLVDDDRTFCRVLADALRRRGHDVVIAHNIRDGIEEAEAWNPHRAVVDLRMPGESGLDLVRTLKQSQPDLKILVLTGYGSIATAVEAVKRGAIQYLTKPVSAAELLRAFEEEALDSRTPEEEPQALSLDVVEWEHLQRVLAECEGNVSAAARRLNMHRRTLQRKLARGRGQ